MIKEKRSVRIIAAVLALVLVFALSACSGSAKDNAGNASNSAQTENAANSAQEGDAADNSAEIEKAVVSVKNGASSANTTEVVNGLHVYCPNTADKDDYPDGAEVELGTRITVFVYNMASPVHLTIVHNGQTIADKDYEILVSDDQVEKISFDLEGDLTVTTQALEISKSAITITDKVGSPDVQLVVRYVNDSNEPVDIESGDELEDGTLIYVQVINASANPVKVSAVSGGETVDSAEIDAKPQDDDASFGGLMGIELKGDMEIVLE